MSVDDDRLKEWYIQLYIQQHSHALEGNRWYNYILTESWLCGSVFFSLCLFVCLFVFPLSHQPHQPNSSQTFRNIDRGNMSCILFSSIPKMHGFAAFVSPCSSLRLKPSESLCLKCPKSNVRFMQ